MVMGQFVTTYRKDYLWPYVKTIGLRPEPEHLHKPQLRDPNACACHCLPLPPPTSDQQVTILGPAANDQEAWSRLGPMGPLLDPKLYPAKVSAAPESDISRYNQPNVFLKKLEEKYPFIYECLRVAPPGDIVSRINRDRLATTYQVDFCKKMEYPSAPYDELLRAAGVAGMEPCPEPKRLPGDVCRPLPKSTITKRLGGGKACSGIPAMDGGKGGGGRGGGGRGGGGGGGGGFGGGGGGGGFGGGAGGGGGLTPAAPDSSEYQDTVSRLGNLIIREGLHNRKPKRGTIAKSVV